MNLGRENFFKSLNEFHGLCLISQIYPSVEHMEENKFFSDKINTVKCIKL